MFTTSFGKYVCDGDKITCEVEGFTATATIYRDDDASRPDERQDGFWPSQDPKDAGYVTTENYETEMAKAKRVMKAWEKDEWFYCGVDVTIECNEIQLTQQYRHALWGIECNYPDSDNDYLREVANENLREALIDAREKITKLTAAT